MPTATLPVPVAAVQTGAGTEGPARLKILTWNIWMMPWFTFQSPRNHERAAAIAAELLKLDFDILCLEKSFDGGARDVLSKALKARYPHQYGPANSGFSLKINSGVWVLSRFPLSDPHEIQFRDCAGIECLSRKGALMLTGTFQGHRFHVIATHLQGEEGPVFTLKHQLIRNRQMTQIREELITRYAQPGVPLFLCGDFDTPRFEAADPSHTSAGYEFVLQTFDGPLNHPERLDTLDDNRLHNDLAIDNTGRTDEMDYILVRPNGANIVPQWSRLILLHSGWDSKSNRKNLSYRYAIGASLEFR